MRFPGWGESVAVGFERLEFGQPMVDTAAPDAKRFLKQWIRLTACKFQCSPGGALICFHASQKLNFKPSCNTRPPLALVISPKLELPRVVPAAVPPAGVPLVLLK